MTTVSMHSWLRKRILIGFSIKNRKYVNNLLERWIESNKYKFKKKLLINLREVDIIGVKKD